MSVCWLGFLWSTLLTFAVVREVGIAVLELVPSDWPVGKSMRLFQKLMVGMGGPSPLQVVPSLGKWSWVV